MSLQIEATVKTPKVIFDSSTGLISISGISIPEDPHEFYGPLEEELTNYLVKPSLSTLLEFKLEYFNTSSTLIIRNIIRQLQKVEKITKLKIKWFYESDDEDMKEAGSEFKMLFNSLDFEVISVSNF
jgi:hypothetical protein